MPALVLTELIKVSYSPVRYEKKEVAFDEAGYKAFRIPIDVKTKILVLVDVNTAAEYSIQYTLSDGADMAQGTHRTRDVFGVNQTIDRDVEIPAGPSAVIVTLVSGSIDIEVVAL